MDWPGIIHTLAPKAIPLVVEAFRSADANFSDFQVNTPLRQAPFLANVLHETGGGQAVEENLNYSAAGLLRVFPKYFPDEVIAKAYAHQPERIANRIYAQRMGNKSVGDGYRFRGRGLFQLTGRKNYEAMGQLAALPLHIQPELAISQRYLLPVALHFWNSRGLSALADKEDFQTIVYRINGGFNGLKERLVWLEKVKAVLGVS